MKELNTLKPAKLYPFVIGADYTRKLGQQLIAVPAHNPTDSHTFIPCDDGLIEAETPTQARSLYIQRMNRRMLMRRVI